MVSTRPGRKGVIEIYPRFIIPTKRKSADLMIRGGDFYAVWIEELGLWSTDEGDALHMIDRELDLYLEKNKEAYAEYSVKVLHMWDAQTGMIDAWHKYCKQQLRDCYHPLDEKLIFSNDKTKKEDYASKRLSYPLADGSIESYEKLMSVLYSDEERQKIEWGIGAVISGDSKTIQKFLVLYGEAGTGKGTVLELIAKLFEGYTTSFEAKVLGTANASFALEAFKDNPLVAIDYDAELSRIEDNTRLNSLVSHEEMVVNEKFKSMYKNRFRCFLFLGTNRPVKITDAKSGLLRRLIDVSPSGSKVPSREYKKLVKQMNFELGAIAKHCLDVYLADPDKYENYIPFNMLGASNDFYNFMLESFDIFNKNNGTTLKAAYGLYEVYCQESKVPYPFSKTKFKEELKNYFKDFEARTTIDGEQLWNYYHGFRTERFAPEEPVMVDMEEESKESGWLKFDKTTSIFDTLYADCKAQYANNAGTPTYAWDNVITTLKDLDTSKLHYVLTQDIEPRLIFVDFDIPDPETGEKNFLLNYAEAVKWPPTYAELSKSGQGIHLFYIYLGDVEKLQKEYAPHIEIQVATGKHAMRRLLTKCNDISIAEIGSGLPLKKGDKVLNERMIKSERGLRNQLIRNLNKEIHPSTKSSIDFIKKILDDAYDSGLVYDVSDMENDIFMFALSSTNNSKYCSELVSEMKFSSAKEEEPIEHKANIVFFDCEVFPNLFILCWKKPGDAVTVRMINPLPKQVEMLFSNHDAIGFNNRKYDNHICYARIMGYNNEQLYNLSQRIISNDKSAMFGSAYTLSYTDIYDFSSKKQSLKKFEIELGIHHQELGLPWDQPVPEELWEKVADYCVNDVIATEAVFEARKADFTAREILADVAGMTVNDTTNSLTTRIIFGGDRNPQHQFNYRNMGDESQIHHRCHQLTQFDSDFGALDPIWTAFDKNDRPIFPGYCKDIHGSHYRDEIVGEGGYVYAENNMWWNVALIDVASMHPSSAEDEALFGIYTKNFTDLKYARIAIKHGEFDKAKTMLDGKLAKYLTDPDSADGLAQALKIAINSVYGLTAANFNNEFRDPRNTDNIVAKRGALFMVNLKHEVQRRGFVVAHIKTDSIKIPNATKDIIDFVVAYGKLYGYNFEHEATYDRMCLVNDAVYIAKYATVERCNELYGLEYVSSAKDIVKDCKKHGGEWTATGAQFAVPYVFKTLFSKEPLEFSDYCETKSVAKGAIYLDMNELLPDVSALEKELDKASTAYRKGKLSDTTYDEIKARLEPEIAKGHNYIFVGRVGQFTPIEPGFGGGELMCLRNDKYYSVSGAKGYRWLESETCRNSSGKNKVDSAYYENLVKDAVDTISKYGDFEDFVNGPSRSLDNLEYYMNLPVTDSEAEEIPFT